MSSKNIFQERLSSLRNGKGISQAELAGLLGKNRITIVRWEAGEYEPCIDDLVKLSQVFNVTVDYLVGNDKPRI